jgi:hypothetical protein
MSTIGTCNKWGLNPKKPSTLTELNIILYDATGKKQLQTVTINPWRISTMKTAHVTGKATLPGKPTAHLEWSTRISPGIVSEGKFQSLYGRRDAKAQQIYNLSILQADGHLFDPKYESSVALTHEMVLNPKNYGDDYVPPKIPGFTPKIGL